MYYLNEMLRKINTRSFHTDDTTESRTKSDNELEFKLRINSISGQIVQGFELYLL